MLPHALKLAASGLFVFPCRPRTKIPAMKEWPKLASRDPQQISHWWAADADFNIGIATGEMSNVFVIDVDSADGEAALCRLGALPATVEAITARGRHMYFRMPKQPIGNSNSKIAPHVDVLGTGRFVLAPPSIHPSGKRYRWAPSGVRIAEAPGWLLALLDARARGDYTPASSAWRNLDPIVEGTRNETLASLTGYLIRAHLDIHLIRHIVQLWNAAHCVPPLDDDEASNIVASVARTHLRNYSHA